MKQVMKNKKIELFVPFPYRRKPLNHRIIEEKFEHKPIYASKGRNAIYHILRSYKIFDGTVAISSYMCPSITDVLIKNGYNVVYYDIDLRDLNPDVDDIKEVITTFVPVALIAASMYGNPADLPTIERICKENHVILIDDAAQSFGAKIGQKYVGSFGNAGFFSFSPGKPTAAYMGAYFWTEREYNFQRKNHFWYRLVAYEYFKHNRYLSYKNHRFRKIIWGLLLLLFKDCDIKDDVETDFINSVLGGVIEENFGHAFLYRKKWFNIFLNSFSNNVQFRIIKELRGISNPSKIVLLFEKKEEAQRFRAHLNQCGIAFYEGYIINKGKRKINNVDLIANRIVEIPIDADEQRMETLLLICKQFLYSTES